MAQHTDRCPCRLFHGRCDSLSPSNRTYLTDARWSRPPAAFDRSEGRDLGCLSHAEGDGTGL